jgi:hypothetical protein
MVSAKQRLKAAFREYYRSRGYGQRRTEKHVKSDLCAFVRNIAEYYDVTPGHVSSRMAGWAKSGLVPVSLDMYATMFVWHRTREGHVYWANRFGFY